MDCHVASLLAMTGMGRETVTIFKVRYVRVGLLMKKALCSIFAILLSAVLVACNAPAFSGVSDGFTPGVDGSGKNDNGQSTRPPGYTSADTVKMPGLDVTPEWVEITFLAGNISDTLGFAGHNSIMIHDSDIIDELISLYQDAEYVETDRPMVYPGFKVLLAYRSEVVTEFTIACNQTEDGALVLISGNDLGQGNKLLTSMFMFDYIKDLWEDQYPYTRVLIEEYDGMSAEALEPIYENDMFVYSLSSIRSHGIVLAFIDGNRTSLREALDRKIVNIHDLIYSGLRVYVDAKPGCDAMTYSSFYSMLLSDIDLMPTDMFIDEEGFFAVARRVLYINDEILTVYEFPSVEAMETNAGYVDESGYGMSFPGRSVHVSWVSNPYWFKSGIVIVNYVGENQEILDFLHSNLEFFAGHRDS